jgi:hypothetical protein
MASDFVTQIRFELNTLNRTDVVNPNFGEFVMGYPLDWTTIPEFDWFQARQKMYKY